MSISRRSILKAAIALPLLGVGAANASAVSERGMYNGIKTPKTVEELTDAMLKLFSPVVGEPAVLPVVYAWAAQSDGCVYNGLDVLEAELVRMSWLTATAHHSSGRTSMCLRSIPALHLENIWPNAGLRISIKFRAAFI